jgi:hypothetical protein
MANGCHTHQTTLIISNFIVQCNFYKGRASFRLLKDAALWNITGVEDGETVVLRWMASCLSNFRAFRRRIPGGRPACKYIFQQHVQKESAIDDGLLPRD